MNRTLSLFLSLVKNWLRSKEGVFFSILFPVMLLLIFSTIFGGQGTPEYTLYVQDDDNTDLSENFTEALDSTEILNVKEVDNITEHRKESSGFGEYRALRIEEGFKKKAINKSIELRMRVIKNTSEYAKREDENYSGNWTQNWSEEGFQTNESAKITFFSSPGDQGAPIVEGAVRSVVDSFDSYMIGIGDNSTITVEKESVQNKDLEPVDYYLPGFIAAFIMSNGIIGVTSNISEYKRNGTLKRLTATPLEKKDWILANVAQQTLLAFVLTAVMILLSIIIFDAQAYPGPYSLGLIFIGSVAFCSVGIVLGGLIKDVEAASGAGNAIAFPIMFLSGAFIPIEQFPSYLKTVAKFLPLYYFHQGLREIMILQNPSGAYLAYLVLGVFAAIFVVLAVKTTRWKDL